MLSDRVSEIKPGGPSTETPFLPRWVAWLALPAVAMPIGIFVFVLTTESAHDELRCPFVERGHKQLGAGVRVIEEGRNCVSDIEERRYTLVRAGASRVLGNRRLDRAAFAPGSYQWSAEVSPAGEVRVTVENRGHGHVLFREGTPEEKQRDGR